MSIRKKKILFAGAWGYGNVGDDLYRDLWPNLLPEYDCILDRFDEPYAYGDLDAIVIGGGGLINTINLRHQFRIAKFYDAAKRANIPLIFASIGCMPVTDNPIKELSGYKPILEYASYVTARSTEDEKLIKAIAPESNTYMVHDLGYLVKPHLGHFIPPDSTVIVPYGGKDWIASQALKTAPSDSIILCFSPDDLQLAKTLGSHIITGLDASQCCSVLRDAREVYVSRYHAYVLARVSGQTNINLVRSTWKLDNEVKQKFDDYNKESAMSSVYFIRSAVEDRANRGNKNVRSAQKKEERVEK